jgi:hypothetical protein
MITLLNGNKKWRILCIINILTIVYFIRELDGMPGATVSYTNEAPEHTYRIGFPLGFQKVRNFFFAKIVSKLKNIY